MNLKGEVAIVTGGNSGIGHAIVPELMRQSANIVIDYVAHQEATEALEKQVRALGDRVIGVKADVSKLAELQNLFATAVNQFGRVDIMVNNAGIETRTSVLDTTEEQYHKVLSINLKSAFFGTQLAAQQMIKQGGDGDQLGMVAITFLTLVGVLGHAGTFWLYGVIAVGAWVFFYLLVPETKGKSLEQIEAHGRAGRSPREL